MREVDLTGLQVSGDEQRRLHAAIGRARQRTRLWQNFGVRARPAVEPGLLTFRRNVGAESAGSESLLAQRLVQPGLPDAELTPDFLAAVGCRRRWRTARAIDQRLGEPRRHEEAHQLSADVLGHVDAD